MLCMTLVQMNPTDVNYLLPLVEMLLAAVRRSERLALSSSVLPMAVCISSELPAFALSRSSFASSRSLHRSAVSSSVGSVRCRSCSFFGVCCFRNAPVFSAAFRAGLFFGQLRSGDCAGFSATLSLLHASERRVSSQCTHRNRRLRLPLEPIVLGCERRLSAAALLQLCSQLRALLLPLLHQGALVARRLQ